MDEITIKLEDAAKMYGFLLAYETINKNNLDDVQYKVINQLIEGNRSIVNQYFLTLYEDEWDFTHNTLDRGLMLRYFLKEKRPDHQWMFSNRYPVHLSEVPDSIRDEYKQYLREALAEHWDVKPEDLDYTLDHAVDEFIENELLYN